MNRYCDYVTNRKICIYANNSANWNRNLYNAICITIKGAVGICSCKNQTAARVGGIYTTYRDALYTLWQNVLTAITCIYNALPINRASILKYFWTCVDSDLISVYTHKNALGTAFVTLTPRVEHDLFVFSYDGSCCTWGWSKVQSN